MNFLSGMWGVDGDPAPDTRPPKRASLAASYDLYDEQNEITHAEMMERYALMHDEDASFNSGEYGYDDDDEDELDVEQVEMVEKSKGKKKKKSKSNGGRLRGSEDESDGKESEADKPGNSANSHFQTMRNLVRKRASLMATFLEHATDSAVLKVYNKWVVHHSTEVTHEQFYRYSEIAKCNEDFQNAGGWHAAPHSVSCSVRFATISDINPVHGTFKCKGFIDIRWYDQVRSMITSSYRLPMILEYDDTTSLVPPQDYEDRPIGTMIHAVHPETGERMKSLISQPYIKNSVADMVVEPQSDWVLVREFKDDPKGLCHFSWVFHGTCSEEFELHEFPFDIQDLTVRIIFQVRMISEIIIQIPEQDGLTLCFLALLSIGDGSGNRNPWRRGLFWPDNPSRESS